MKTIDILKGKYVLIVDDEPDVLDSLIELLETCKIDTATSFEEGKQLLERRSYDIAILDIMGVNGFELLNIAKNNDIPAIMLTANAMNQESLNNAAEKGAAYFAPKEKMIDIAQFLSDVFVAIDEKKNPWEKLVDRLGSFYDKRFHGTNWKEQENDYWKKKMRNKF